MRFETLAEWLSWQEGLHPRSIDLGLERTHAVAERLGLLQPAAPVVTVAGTNGKGSTLACLEAIYASAGQRTGLYTSPHLWRYNERIRIDRQPASDAAIMTAFEAVDGARGDTSLSYFEFGTLAALWLFAHEGLDVILLEVGLGGRLDAVNVIDADVAVVTAIGIDHVDWLGDDREAIGREKAGIFRAGRPAICADPAPPASVRATAEACGACWYGIGETYHHAERPADWDWWCGRVRREALPLSPLGGGHQLDNAAAALMAVECLQPRLPVSMAAIIKGLQTVSLPGRFQCIDNGRVHIFDVAHNPQAAQVLAQRLAELSATGRTLAVFAVFGDKDLDGMLRPLLSRVDSWYLGGLQGVRARSADTVAECLQRLDVDAVRTFDSPGDAYRAACLDAGHRDRILVCGSFHTVGEVLALLEADGVPVTMEQ